MPPTRHAALDLLILGIVVAGEGVEGAELHPAGAQLLRGAAGEAADVRPDQRDAEEAEAQQPCRQGRSARHRDFRRRLQTSRKLDGAGRAGRGVRMQPVPPTWDGVIHVLPLAPVVAQPVPRVPALAGEGGAGDDEGALPPDLDQGAGKTRGEPRAGGESSPPGVHLIPHKWWERSGPTTALWCRRVGPSSTGKAQHQDHPPIPPGAALAPLLC